jgi:NAD(P)H-flavin reductase
MTATMPSPPATSPWKPEPATITAIRQEVPGVATYDLMLPERGEHRDYRFLPGQFNMLYLPGYGESAISVSSNPTEHRSLAHTVRVAGNVTQALSRKQTGEQIGLRGPFGTSWPMQQCRGHDVVLACGGIGLAPLRPAIYHIINSRADYGRVLLLYGARTAGGLLYNPEYDQWRAADIEVEVTVDLGEPEWGGHIGVVPALFYHLRLDGRKTFVMTCGPEIMIRFVIFEALARKVPPEKILLSLERNMSCAMGFCGHCQLGPMFVCKDGPVFNYVQMEPYLNLEDL